MSVVRLKELAEANGVSAGSGFSLDKIDKIFTDVNKMCKAETGQDIITLLLHGKEQSGALPNSGHPPEDVPFKQLSEKAGKAKIDPKVLQADINKAMTVYVINVLQMLIDNGDGDLSFKDVIGKHDAISVKQLKTMLMGGGT